jgi:hypothetical protein
MRGRRRGLGTFLFLSALLVQGILAAEESDSAVNESLAAVYFSHADEAHRAGDEQGALQLVRESLSLSVRSADALYLLALVESPGYSADFSLRRSRISPLEAAIDLDNFRVYTREDAVYLLCESLIGIGEFAKAEKILLASGDKPSLNPRGALLLAQCAYFAKRDAVYRQRLTDALKRFPDDPRIARFFLLHANATAKSAADGEAIGMLSRRFESLVAQDPEIFVLFSAFAQDREERARMLRRYRSAGAVSRRGTIESLRNGLAAETDLADEFWKSASGSQPLDYSEIREFYDLLASMSVREAFLERLRGFSGSLVQDDSGDGRPEIRSAFEQGELVEWTYDPDQDGEIDIRAYFSDGLPSRIETNLRGERISFSYAQYPEVESAQWLAGGSTSVYEFGGNSLNLPALSFRLPFRAEGLTRLRQAKRDSGVSVPTPDAMARMAISIEEKFDEADARGLVQKRKLTQLSGGVVLSYEEFSSGLPVLKREYRNGIPIREMSVYHQPQGYWEVVTTFEKTREQPYYRKLSLSMDADGDGIEEYRETYSPVLRKEWDYDSSGAYDVAEESYPDKTLLYFSSKLDGTLDVRLELKNERITAVRRQGRDLAVTKESGGELYWIGEKPFDLWKSIPERDGVYMISGKRILFYRSGKTAFAEVVQ